jgi:hypothetical protein
MAIRTDFAPTPCGVTVWRSPLVLAKQITPGNITAASGAKHFDAESLAIADLNALRDLIATLLDDPHACIVRGALLDPTHTKHIRRLLHGEHATLREEPRRWVAIDCEGVQRPDHIPATDVGRCARHVISNLPAAFHHARCIVQASASHGRKPDIRLRLWYWLDRPVSGDELKHWFAGTAGVDPSIFSPAFITYTARPIFLDGASDPCPQRLAELPGAACVAVPSPHALAQPKAVARPPVAISGPVPEGLSSKFINAVLDRVRNSEGANHRTLFNSARSLGGIAQQIGFSEDAAWGWLSAALPGTVRDWKSAEQTAREGFQVGLESPIPLRGEALQKIDYQTSTPPEPPPHPGPDDGWVSIPLPGPSGPAPIGPGSSPPPPDPRAEWLKRERLIDAPPPSPLPTATPDEVHAAVLHAIQSFFGRRHQRPAPCVVTPGPTGSGKTHKVGITLPHIIAADIAERKRQMIAGEELSPHRWAVLVPAHKLGRQVADRYRQHGLNPAIFEGRGDPWKANPKRSYPCTQLESVKLAMQARASISKNVCGKKGPHHQCPDRRGCRYFSQFVDAIDANVVIAANTFVFDELPEPLRHDLAGVIIDESFIENADRIGELSVESFRRPALMAWPCRRTNGTEDGIATMRLMRLSDRLVAMLDAHPDGYLPDDAPVQAGLTTNDLEELRKLHQKRRVKPRMYPGMPLDKRKEALRDAEINGSLPKIAAALRMMKDGHASRIRLFTKNSKNGTTRGMVLHGQREVAKWLRDLPKLILDASARQSDIERFFSDVEFAPIPQPALPHQHVHQYLGAFGKRAMTPYKITALTGHARAHIAAGRESLILCYEKDEADIRAAVPGARIMHHGEYAGDDANGDVDVVMQFGGPFARPGAIAEMATARYGVPVPIANPVHKPCLALMEDGSGVSFERLVYEHPRAQDVHEAIYDNAFVQGGLGRGRGINRTALTPLRDEIFGNVPLPVPLASLQRWRPDRELALFADGGVHSNATDLHEFHRHIFQTLAAAQKWRQRNPLDLHRLQKFFMDAPRLIVGINWQPAGRGSHFRFSIMLADDVPAFRQRLERTRRLVLWRVWGFAGGREESDISHRVSLLNMSGSSTGTAAATAPTSNGGNPPNPWWIDPTLGVPPWLGQAANDHQPRGPPDG